MDTIAIDCGASFIKGGRIEKGEIVRQLSVAAPLPEKSENILIPKQIVALVPLVRDMVSELAGADREIRLCMSNEMHGFLLSYEDGTAFTDYISWQKELGGISVNGVSSTEKIQQEMPEEELLFTGMPLRDGLPICNLYYLTRTGKLDTKCGRLRFYTLGDYLLRMLSGKEPICHPTNAAATGLYDLRIGQWNYTLIDCVTDQQIVFPEIGENKSITFELKGVTVHAFPAIGDQQAALLGSGLKDDRSVSFNMGTGAQVSRLVKTIRRSGKCQIRPYFYGYNLNTLPHIPSGRALNVYFRFIKDILCQFQVNINDDEIWGRLIQTADMAHDSSMICDMSFFENTVTDVRYGSICNIGEYELTLGNLMHAVFSQMIRNFIYASHAIGVDEMNVEQILFSGGVSNRIPAVREGIKKHFGDAIRVINAKNETLLGLYQYGLLAESGQLG